MAHGAVEVLRHHACGDPEPSRDLRVAEAFETLQQEGGAAILGQVVQGRGKVEQALLCGDTLFRCRRSWKVLQVARGRNKVPRPDGPAPRVIDQKMGRDPVSQTFQIVSAAVTELGMQSQVDLLGQILRRVATADTAAKE